MPHIAYYRNCEPFSRTTFWFAILDSIIIVAVLETAFEGINFIQNRALLPVCCCLMGGREHSN